MANRSYLYTIDKVPKSHADRPTLVRGLSEYPYDVPLAYYLLVSDDPKLVPSLLFESDAFSVYALCGDGEPGVARVRRVIDCVLRSEALAEKGPLLQAVRDMDAFFAKGLHAVTYLEIAEIDTMTHGDAAGVRKAAEQHFREAYRLGSWADQLTPEGVAAAMAPGGPLHTVFDTRGQFDNRSGRPLGIGFWSDVLYYEPLTASEWTAQSR